MKTEFLNAGPSDDDISEVSKYFNKAGDYRFDDLKSYINIVDVKLKII